MEENAKQQDKAGAIFEDYGEELEQLEEYGDEVEVLNESIGNISPRKSINDTSKVKNKKT